VAAAKAPAEVAAVPLVEEEEESWEEELWEEE